MRYRRESIGKMDRYIHSIVVAALCISLSLRGIRADDATGYDKCICYCCIDATNSVQATSAKKCDFKNLPSVGAITMSASASADTCNQAACYGSFPLSCPVPPNLTGFRATCNSCATSSNPHVSQTPGSPGAVGSSDITASTGNASIVNNPSIQQASLSGGRGRNHQRSKLAAFALVLALILFTTGIL
ncbi:uncharacterized protein BJ171DRAFT_502027, partial [Polychytrium aggregatum]|uniref:uncharacterized protein n=1 Tax=Polychytrium aggregatum TaxID=110093 RepID=UPI0022FEFA6D